MSAIETYLRSEHATTPNQKLYSLIDEATIDDALKADLHKLRRYRNKWVHVDEPWDDQQVIDSPERFEGELEEMALFAARAVRRTIYENQWV